MARVPSAKSSRVKTEIMRLSSSHTGGEIAKIFDLSRSYVNRILRDNNIKVSRDPVGFDEARNVHGQRLRLFVHSVTDRYSKSPNTFFKNIVEGVDVQAQGKFIYLNARDRRFRGESETKALWSSVNFWQGVIKKVESRLGVIIFKAGARAFEFLYSEVETPNSVVAIDCEKRGHRWTVYHTEDGKLRLTADWSEGVPNHETHHFRDAHVDSITMNSFVNDVLDNPDLNLSKIASAVAKMVDANNETAQGLNAVVNIMKQEREVARSNATPSDPVSLSGGDLFYVG